MQHRGEYFHGKTRWAVLLGGMLFGLVYVFATQEPDFDPWSDY